MARTDAERMYACMHPDLQAGYVVMVNREDIYEYALYQDAMNRAKSEAHDAIEVVVTQDGFVVKIWNIRR